MTYGDEVRDIRKMSKLREIKTLENKVREILNNDGGASEHDTQIKAYRQIIAEKKRQLENL